MNKKTGVFVIIILFLASLASCGRNQSAPESSPGIPEPQPSLAFGPWYSEDARSLPVPLEGEFLPVEGSSGLAMALAAPGGACAVGGSSLVFCTASGQVTRLELEKEVLEVLGIAGRGESWRILLLDSLGVLALDPRDSSSLSRLPAPLPQGDAAPMAALGTGWLALATERGSLAFYSLPDFSAGPVVRGLPDIQDLAWWGSSLVLLGAEGALSIIEDPEAVDILASLGRMETDPLVKALEGGPAGLIARGRGSAFYLPLGGSRPLEIAALSPLQNPLPTAEGFVVRSADGRLCLLASEFVEGAPAPYLDAQAISDDPFLPLSARRAGDSWLSAAELELHLREGQGKNGSRLLVADPALAAPFVSASTLWYLGSAGLWRLSPPSAGNGYPIDGDVLSNIMEGLGNIAGASRVEAADLDILPWLEGLAYPLSRKWRIHSYDSPDGSAARIGVKGKGRYLIALFNAEGNSLGNNVGYEVGESLSLSLSSGSSYWFAFSPTVNVPAGDRPSLEVRRGGE